MLINVKMQTNVEKFYNLVPDWFQSYLVGTPEDKFTPDDAHIEIDTTQGKRLTEAQ